MSKDRISRRTALKVGFTSFLGVSGVGDVFAQSSSGEGEEPQQTPIPSQSSSNETGTLAATHEVIPINFDEIEVTFITEGITKESFFDLSLDQLDLIETSENKQNYYRLTDETVTISIEGMEYTGKRFIKTVQPLYTSEPALLGVEKILNPKENGPFADISGVYLGMAIIRYDTKNLETSSEYRQFLEDNGITQPETLDVRYIKLYYIDENGDAKIGLFSTFGDTKSIDVSPDTINLQQRDWSVIEEELSLGDQIILSPFDIDLPSYDYYQGQPHEVLLNIAQGDLYFDYIDDLESRYLGQSRIIPNVFKIAYQK